ncbi:MAG: tRNA 2-thiouridine(34) synthase MnmA [Planctomycetota bacterium]|nr:tRNA 2-thiouridine(34) synthase MnmA [Planctomycetota bacterium]
MSRIVLALSGGVDSSVAGHLLKQAGHEVMGVFILHAQGLRTDNSQSQQPEQGCGSEAVAAEARKAADELGIQFEVLDLQSEFQPVIDYFVDEYAAGRTPNPCIFCNALIKFGKLFEYAKSIGADHLATGHYARILDAKKGSGSFCAKHPPGRSGKRVLTPFSLCRGRDPDKDQSYFLYNIDRRILPKLIFPVGEYTKAEIRRMAAELDLHAAEKPDSQDVCFVDKEEHAGFVRQVLAERAGSGRGDGSNLPERPEGCFAQIGPVPFSGPIVTADGTEVGRHQGIENFTVGQRKGIGVALGEPHYVIRIEAQGRRVIVGTRGQLARGELTASSANWLVEPRGERFRAEVKIRYSSQAVAAEVEIIDSDRFRVVFDTPCFGVAPGQAAVCYDGDVVLGGGWIE